MDRSCFLERHIEVLDAVRAEVRVNPGLVAERVVAGVREAGLLNQPPAFTRASPEPAVFLSQPGTTLGRVVPAPKVDCNLFEVEV